MTPDHPWLYKAVRTLVPCVTWCDEEAMPAGSTGLLIEVLHTRDVEDGVYVDFGEDLATLLLSDVELVSE